MACDEDESSALLLSTGLEHPQSRDRGGPVRRRARPRRELYLYLIDDGVRALDDPRIQALAGARREALRLRVRLPEAPAPAARRRTVTYCGLVVLTDLINGTDRFVALN